MASNNETPRSSGPRPGGRRKRPVEPRPLELEATEVREQAASPSEPASEAAPPAEEPAAEAAAQPEPVAAQGAEAQSPSQEPAEEPAVEQQAASEAPAAGEHTDEAAAAGERPAAVAGARQTSFRPGTARLAAAGIAGGLVVLVVMLALALAGIWPGADDPEMRMDLAAAEARIAALETAEAPVAADPEPVAGLAARLDALEGRLDDVPGTPDLGPIEDRLGALEAAPAAPELPDDVGQRLSALEGGVEELAAALSNLAEEGPPDPQVAEQLSRVESAVAERLSQFEAGLADQLSQIETALAEERGARQALGERLDRLEATVAEGEATADRRIVHAAAGAVALGGLSRALEAGQPYERQLAAIRPLVDEAMIETLSAHAASGLPSSAELAEEFADRANAILAAGEDAAGPDGVLERFTAGVRSLVRVRPARPIDGDSRAAIVSRIEAALAAGNLAEAHREWQGLDAAAREASADWAAALAARVAAEDELAAISAETTAALGAFLDDAE